MYQLVYNSRMKTLKQQRGRPREFNEHEVLSAAMNYFWVHGYENSSLDALLKVMSIKKSSFYATFKSKKELFKKVLDFYREYQISFLQSIKEAEGPKRAMLSLLEHTFNEFQNSGNVRGCLLMNSGRECYGRYEDISHQVEISFNYLLHLFTSYIEEAQKRGEIVNTKEARFIASRYVNTLNGLVVTIRVGASEDVIDDIVKSAKEILE